jgi:hypothetical protein
MEEVNRKHYMLWYRLESKNRFLIWHTSDSDNSDGVVVTENMRIPYFTSKAELLDFSEKNRLRVEDEEPVMHDLDAIVRWLKTRKRKRSQKIDCADFLCAWNLFADASKSIGEDFDSNRNMTNKIYDKLFCANNLPSVTPAGKSYEPIWTRREVAIMRDVMSRGLSILRKNLIRP